jgi:Immunoglobulin domain
VTLVSTPVLIGFNVVDAETPAGALVVSVQSSNPSIVPPAGIALGGSDGNRALLISPVANTTGTVAIVVTVMDGRGATASDTFLLQVRPPGQPPSIVSQPASQTISAGSPATFVVVAACTAPLTYQWELNGLALVNRTNTTLTFAAVQSVDAGAYRVRVSNALGSVLSEAAVLRVLVSPAITAITNNGSRAEISFSSLSGLNYVVEYRNAVNAGAWSVLASAPGTGGVITVIDPEPTNSSRFYRVRVE